MWGAIPNDLGKLFLPDINLQKPLAKAIKTMGDNKIRMVRLNSILRKFWPITGQIPSFQENFQGAVRLGY